VTLNYLEMMIELEGFAAPLVGALELSQLMYLSNVFTFTP